MGYVVTPYQGNPEEREVEEGSRLIIHKGKQVKDRLLNSAARAGAVSLSDRLLNAAARAGAVSLSDDRPSVIVQVDLVENDILNLRGKTFYKPLNLQGYGFLFLFVFFFFLKHKMRKLDL